MTRFDGREGGLSLDGEVTSVMLGADWSRDALMTGVLVSHSLGEGGYRGKLGSGAASSSLTALYPWGRYALSERLSVWGLAGYGEGALTLTPEGEPMRTDLDLMMAAPDRAPAGRLSSLLRLLPSCQGKYFLNSPQFWGRARARGSAYRPRLCGARIFRA